MVQYKLTTQWLQKKRIPLFTFFFFFTFTAISDMRSYNSLVTFELFLRLDIEHLSTLANAFLSISYKIELFFHVLRIFSSITKFHYTNDAWLFSRNFYVQLFFGFQTRWWLVSKYNKSFSQKKVTFLLKILSPT